MESHRQILSSAEIDAVRDLATVWPPGSFVIVGASALGFYYEMTWRQTQDLDFTVALPSGTITADLTALSWRRDPKFIPRWFSRSGARVDVVPADPASLVRGTLDWGDGFVMKLTGLHLAFDHAEPHDVDRDLAVRVAPPHVIAFLKVVAYLDRPADRVRDLVDLAHLLEAYVDDDSDRRWTDADGVDFDSAPAFLLGLDLGRILSASERSILDSFIESDRARALLAAYGPSHWRSETDPAEQPLRALREGMAMNPAVR